MLPAMKQLYGISLLILTCSLLWLQPNAVAQRFPDMMHLSSDGKRLITGNKTSTGFYEPFLMHDIHLNFSDPDYWNELEDNYDDKEDIPATMTINGVVYDSVGVRFKGHSSYTRIGNSVKKSFNISLNEYIDGQDIDGYNTLNLNNCYNDASFMSEVLYEGQARKHIPAPQGNFAHLFINGQDWGVYANVQQVNRDLIKEWFSSDEGSLLRAKRPEGSPGIADTVGRASMNYLGNDPVEYSWYYTQKYSDIQDIYEKLMETCHILDTVSSSRMESILGEVLDLDRTLWFLAMEIAFTDMDGYCHKGKNDYYLFYEEETGRFHPVEMDGNDVLETLEINQLGVFYHTSDVNFPLLSRILNVPSLRQRYLAHMRTIITECLDTSQLFPLIDTYKAILDPFVNQNTPKLYTYADFLSKVQEIKANLTARKNFLLADPEVNRTPPLISDVEWLAGQTAWIRPSHNQDVTVRARASSSSGIDRVYLYHATELSGQFSKTRMYDDGTHDDLAAGDGIYGAEIDGEDGGTWVRFYIEAIADNSQKTASYDPPGAEHDVYAYLVAPDAASDRSVVINEIMAENVSTVSDPAGEFVDWIELYNNSSQPKNISGYYLTDNPLNLVKWRFPVGTVIPPGDYLIVWANDDPDVSALHTNFKLSSAGEQLLLLNDDLELVDSITFGPQLPDMSFARVLNGTGNFISQPATFGANNNPQPAASFVTTLNKGCAPLTVQFVNTSTNSLSSLWDFGDGSFSTDFSPQHTYTDTGSFQVILMSSVGADTDTFYNPLPIVVSELVPFEFPDDTVRTSNLTYLLDAGTSHISYHWSNGDTGNTILVSSDGLYCVTVTDAGECTDSDCIYVIVNTLGIGSPLHHGFEIYPNPVSQGFFIKETDVNALSEIEIFNAMGEIVYADRITGARYIATADWTGGVYLIRSGDTMKKILLIKQ